MRFDLLFFGNQIEQDARGSLAFLACGLLDDRNRRRSDADPFGVIEAQKAHGFGMRG